VIEHYNEHQKSQDSFNSFFSFLKEHYSKNHKSNKDEKNFPFKSLMANSFHLIHQDYQQIEILEFDLSNSSEKVVFNYINYCENYNANKIFGNKEYMQNLISFKETVAYINYIFLVSLLCFAFTLSVFVLVLYSSLLNMGFFI
jgi:hypothetical protein